MRNNLKKYRLKRGLTLLDIAKKTNIATSDISQMETGKKYPFPGWRKRLSQAFDISEEELFPEVD